MLDVVPVLAPVRDVAEHPVEVVEDLEPAADRQAPALELCVGLALRRRLPALARPDAVQREAQRAAGGGPRVLLPQAAGGGRVPIKYYLTAMLFIVFDIESVFLYPFAVAFNQLGLFALVEMVLFILTVFVAYAYVWRRGGLEWD